MADELTATARTASLGATGVRSEVSGPALIVSYEGLLGGAGRLLLDLAVALDEPVLACPPSPLADRASEVGLNVAHTRSRRVEVRAGARDRLAAPLRLAGHALEVRHLVRALRPRVVISWGMRATLACAAALAGRRNRPPLVFQHNDLLPGPLIGRTVRAAASRADLVITPSRTIADDLDPGRTLADRITVLPPAVDLELFDFSPLPDGPPSVLTLGWLVPYKRPELALEVMALAARELPDLRLSLVGARLDDPAGRELAERLEERTRQPDLAGRVALAGPVADPRVALRDCHCLLHCADREPFGIVVLEALATGRPVVAPAGGGPAEVLDDSCGRLYPPGDAAAAAAALVEILSDRERLEALASAGRDRVADYGLAAARSRFAELISDVSRASPEMVSSTRRQLHASE
jgi:glycosyltransferase involved in cell wall biosynthesis